MYEIDIKSINQNTWAIYILCLLFRNFHWFHYHQFDRYILIDNWHFDSVWKKTALIWKKYGFFENIKHQWI